MRPIVNVSEEDRATVIGNMHENFCKDRACRSGDILADRQTDRQTYPSQYFPTAPAGEVTGLQSNFDKKAASLPHVDGSVVFTRWRQYTLPI